MKCGTSIRFVCWAISTILWVVGPASVNAADPIKIGAVLPFSGGVELYGAQAKLGLDLAAADINAAGGILGRPVEIVYRDDGTRPNIAADAARKIVEEDGVLAVVGPITSRNPTPSFPCSQATRLRCSMPPTMKVESAIATCSP